MRTIRNSTTRVIARPVVLQSLVLAGTAVLAAAAAAQTGGYYVVPAVTVSAAHDDNIYFEAVGEVDDRITRISPALDVGYQSDNLSWDASYTFDSEAYDKTDELDSWLMRRFANASIEYSPDQQLTWFARANFANTLTPGELNLLTGLEPGRREAERVSVNPGLIYAFNGATTGSLDYLWSNDELEGGVEADSHITTADLQHVLNGENTLTFGYTYRSYEFNNETSAWSHTPRVGWLHQLSPRTLLTLEAGPRISRDAEDPYVLAAISHEFVRGEFELSYSIDEVTLIGEAGRLETERVGASLTYAFNADLEVSVRPAWSQIDRLGEETDVLSIGASARYRLNNALFLVASYQHSDQDVELPIIGPQNLSRSVFSLGFTLTYPRPTGGETGL